MIFETSPASYEICFRKGRKPEDKEQWKKEKEQTEDRKKVQSDKSSRAPEKPNDSKSAGH